MFGRFFLFIREARFCAAPFLICGSQLYIAEVRVAACLGNRVVTGGKTVNYYKSVIVGIFVYRSVYFKLVKVTLVLDSSFNGLEYVVPLYSKLPLPLYFPFTVKPAFVAREGSFFVNIATMA